MSKATTTTATTTTSTKSEVMNVEQQVLNDEPVVVSKSKINKYHKASTTQIQVDLLDF